MMPFLAKALERLWNLKGAEMTGLTVTDVQTLSPHMRRVTFAGHQLDAFGGMKNLHVRLKLPPPATQHGDWLKFGRNGKAMPRDNGLTLAVRKYTIRRIDTAMGRVTIDFLLHGDSGPGSAWARRASIGDRIGMIGPGGGGFGAADWYLLAGDETGLPAIARFLESAPPGASGVVFLEVEGPHEEQKLTMPSGFEVAWLHRDGAAAGTTTLLQDAVLGAAWPDDGRSVFGWAAAEFETIAVIRRHFRALRKLTKQQQLAVAYWRRSVSKEGNADGGL